MRKSKTYHTRERRGRDIETDEVVEVIWRESTVTVRGNFGSSRGKGMAEAFLKEGMDPLNPTGDPKRFKALFSERVIELED